MINVKAVELWLSKMEKRHSKSTRRLYKHALAGFCDFTGLTPDQIVEEWKKVKYDLKARDQLIDEILERVDIYENYLGKRGLCKNSISSYLARIASFFKYMRIPVKIDVFQALVEYHNRDITKEEIQRIVTKASPRDRAFFLIMVQSGLRPVTILQLMYGQIKEDFEKDHVPCAIVVERSQTKGEYVEHLTFIAEDAVRALRAYFRERGLPKENETIFEGVKTPNAFSMRFGYLVRHLGLIKEERMRKKGAPQELRLYCLRKYFKKMAYPAGDEHVKFWMGHTLGVESHYFSRDVEHNRKIYSERAMPNLRIFEKSALETDTTIRKLEKEMNQLKEENLVLKKRLNGFTLNNEQVKKLLGRIEKLEKQAQK
ncbi:hypothetical protein ACFLRN_08040 [Thermoproteota archaeon]